MVLKKKKSLSDLKAEEKKYKKKLYAKGKKDFERAKYAKTKRRVKNLRRKSSGRLTVEERNKKRQKRLAKGVSLGRKAGATIIKNAKQYRASRAKKNKSGVKSSVFSASPQEKVFGKKRS